MAEQRRRSDQANRRGGSSGAAGKGTPGGNRRSDGRRSDGRSSSGRSPSGRSFDNRSSDNRGAGSSSKGSSGKPPRIPRPPKLGEREDRDEVTYERVSDEPRKSKKSKKTSRRPIDVSGARFHGQTSANAEKLRRRLAEAGSAFEAERFQDAERLLLAILKLAPGQLEAIELLGLSYYRLGRWSKAITQLDQFYALSGSVEQHPVLADCNRAMRRWTRVDELWSELGAASPGPDLVEEGRIVVAGSLADRRRLDEAIAMLEGAPKPKRKPAIHHLRRWYALADLYERAGDNSRARRLFANVVQHEPGFGDAAERATAI